MIASSTIIAARRRVVAVAAKKATAASAAASNTSTLSRTFTARSFILQRQIGCCAATTPSSSSSRFFSSSKDGDGETLIPGLGGSQSSYGSLGDVNAMNKSAAATNRKIMKDHINMMDDIDTAAAALSYELTKTTAATIEKVVPWFLRTMPESYFRQIPPYLRSDHLKALTAVVDADMELYLNLKSKTHDGRTVYTYIRPTTEPGTLLSMVEELPQGLDDVGPDGLATTNNSLTRLHVFSSKDDSFSLNMFIYGESQTTLQNASDDDENAVSVTAENEPYRNQILEFAKEVRDGLHEETHPDLDPNHECFQDHSLQEYLNKCRKNYLKVISEYPERFMKQRLLFESVSGTEGCNAQIDEAIHEEHHDFHNESNNKQYWLDVAMANSLPQVALENTCRLLFVQGFDVGRARLDVIPDDDNGTVTMLRLLIHPTGRVKEIEESSNFPYSSNMDQFERLKANLKRMKWIDDKTTKLVFEDPSTRWLGVKRGEIITGMCNLLQPIMLSKEKDQRTGRSSHFYSKHNILSTVTHPRSIGYSAKIASLFLDRFNPDDTTLRDDVAFRNALQELRTEIESNVQVSYVKELLLGMADIVDKTYKTNVYMKDRYALSFRIDPSIMGVGSQDDSTLPYGVVFIHGRRFNGYHVRFRDISRGGLRLVAPASTEQLALESARQYDECYGLAFAQQLKNKDIPEGGSKAVCLIDTNDIMNGTRDYIMRKSVKAMTDSILDLVVDTDETRDTIVDYWGKREVLYLGPDENVIPDDINWIIKRAARRGYDTPAAFMSSKPKAGINHKEYGVTSEGVNVYLDVALKRALGIDPKKDSFTIKMTGGPDGDVAGNEMKILIREYGENAKIVGVADHSGCAEDPNGLDHDELLRLFHNELSISNFDESKLSTGAAAVLHLVDTEEGLKARNTMHNRLVTDAFVPCGGRPNTIDANNYKDFILDDGITPSSKLIVEGANLFVTADARQKLYEDAGVMIVKDSSANKGGVITSSYEICAAMLASEDEFFDNKTEIVEEVLAKLRHYAKMEAELLFVEADLYGESLPEVSQIISNAINSATDALSVALDTLSDEEQNQLVPFFRAHLPQTLADLGFDKIHSNVPEQYIKNAIASTLASKMVYKEGTRFINSLPKKRLAETALKYIRKEKEITKLIESLEKTTDISTDEKNRILELLDAGGARTALNLSK